MFVRNQMASCCWEINLSGRVWEEAGEMVFFSLVCVRRDIMKGVLEVSKPICSLKKATKVDDFVNKKQSDSIKIGMQNF